jgi:TonB family protein
MPGETLTKLSLMVNNPPPDPSYQARKHHSICWPTALLYKEASKREVAGFFMPRIDTKIFQKAFLYIVPPDRRARFGGGFTWKHLVAAATNIASSVDAIHQRGYCIGDLNESNILIAPNALISIIDCDSFQVTDTASGKTYRSQVGKGDYSPPEMIGKNFAEVDRTVAADSFSLATLMFQLLMEGSHPYRAKGRLVDGASTPEAKILLGYFPYTMRSKDIAPPDDVPPFENLHPEIQRLFERCFAIGNKTPAARPTAHEWYSVLQGLEHAFKQCPNNANHTYFDHLKSCPWCAFQSKSGLDLFPPPVGHQVALDDNNNLLESLEKRLAYLTPYVVMAFADGILTPEEESQLTAYGKQLQIPPKEVEKLIKAEAAKVQGARGQAPGSPQITLSQTRFVFDHARHGASLSGRYTITNTGGGTLTGKIKASSAWIKPSQAVIDTTRHIQEHSFHIDTIGLTPGTLNRATIEIASNAGTVRVEVSVSLELESAILKRWRRQFFWAGAALGALFGLGIYALVPSLPGDWATNFSGLVGAISLIVVCAVVGKWGGGIGGFFLAGMLQTIFKTVSLRGYSALAWAEIASAFLFLWAKPLLIAKLAGNRRMGIWAVISGIVVGAVIIVESIAIRHYFPEHVNVTGEKLPVVDILAGSSIGNAIWVQWTTAIGNSGADFSSANSSRIEYPGLIPPRGTIEFWIKVSNGYRYENYQFRGNQSEAMIFSSDVQGGDVTWPGTTKLTVWRNGDLSLWMATNKYDQPHAPATEAHRTQFRFGEWHAIGISYGAQGQYIMLDGKLVASDSSRTQTFGAAGNHQTVLDIPTVGETVSHFWAHHRYEGGFDGTLAEFRVSDREQDWNLAKGVSFAATTLPASNAATPNSPSTELGTSSGTTVSEPEPQNTAAPVINEVSAVSPQQLQTITILGSGFGSKAPYVGDCDCIRVSDITRNWNAGWSKDPGTDKITLAISTWTDKEISISGFAGDYGDGQNRIEPNDEISVEVWNAQTGSGPALFKNTAKSSVAGDAPAIARDSNGSIAVSPEVAQALLLEKTPPIYPPIARAARVSGTVILLVWVSREGSVSNAKVVNGPAMLQEAASACVMKWRYRPYIVNGSPSEFNTIVSLTFSLGSPDSAGQSIQTPLPAPVLISPVEGAVFHNFPRTTTLTWQAAPGAATYRIEVDCYDPPGWDPIQRVSGVATTSFTFSFVGKQRGRWRVWAVDSHGREGEKSPWREFDYTI